MDTKKAIEFIKALFLGDVKNDKDEDGILYSTRANNIIELLQRGKKYEAMWGKLSKKYGNYWKALDIRKGYDAEYKYIDELMDKIKQKYFPEEVRP